jgi:two-component system, OmpR family, sensor histidine kinase KdpD
MRLNMPSVYRARLNIRLYTVVEYMSLGRFRVRSTLVALLGTFAIAVFLYRVAHADATVAATILLLGVLVNGAYARLAEGVVVAIAATLYLDYFFVPPFGSISIRDPGGWIVLIVFLTVSLLATNLSTRLRNQRDELVSQQQEAERLHALSRSMLLSNGAEDVRRIIVNRCMELFGFSEAAVFESSSGQFRRTEGETSISEEVLRQVALYGSPDQGSGNDSTVVPITLGNKILGSFGFRGAALPQATLQALANIIAVGLAQAQAQEAGSRAEAVRKSEELKSIMIDALAHDLKTPLTAIEAASGTLLQPAGTSLEQRYELAQVVQQEANGLRRMVDEAIHLARIDAKKLKLQCEPAEVRDLVKTAIQSLGERATSHRIETSIPGNLPPIFVDRELMAQALKQLLDNAIKYSPSRSVVTISAEEVDGILSISVRDQGQGLTELEQSRIFDKFYRGRRERSAVQGTGMGLAITKEILEAHGGSARVESQVGQGSRFTISLRAATEPATAGQQRA